MPVHGKGTAVLLDEFNLSQYFRDATATDEVQASETTGFNPTGSARTFTVGLRDGKMSFDGLYEGAASSIDAYFASILGNATDRVVTWGPGTPAVGGRTKMCYGICTNYDVDSPFDDVATTSAEFQGDGGVEHGVWLWDLTSVSATANGTSVDNAAGTTNGGVAHLHVPINTRSANVDIKVQHSTDNAVWNDLAGATFTTIGAGLTAKQRLVVAAGVTVSRYLRTVHTLTAGTGAVTYAVGFARR